MLVREVRKNLIVQLMFVSKVRVTVVALSGFPFIYLIADSVYIGI